MRGSAKCHENRIVSVSPDIATKNAGSRTESVLVRTQMRHFNRKT